MATPLDGSSLDAPFAREKIMGMTVTPQPNTPLLSIKRVCVCHMVAGYQVAQDELEYSMKITVNITSFLNSIQSASLLSLQ